ncbi:PRC-barrel domain-containing protein [Dongia rigui]|uniref:PRC-barrel domain-containing protein n=1 Tax=Dongia rigui TaxID=940149 RepID=A0ABU5DVL3_9PROT|nr:PRC-barrel domain-containing protein [Dongia rigui]MDY0870980.1 PRC-barrel domain-containing protein [Dongia rigui]
MKTLLKLTTAVGLVIGSLALPTMAFADSTETPAMGTVDAGTLIGKNVVDAKGDTVGEIDSVMVDANGKVKSVVVDVSGWLQTEKLISLPWKGLTVTDNNVITSRLTQEEAKQAAAYAYVDEGNRRKVLTEKGQVYAEGSDADMTTSSGGDGTMGTPVKNPDGSINASQLVGVNIENGDGDKLGEVGEVVIASDGGLQGVVVDVGGFLGIGTHPVLLNWKDMKISGNGDDIKAIVNTTKDNLKSLPEYKADAASN